MGQRHQIFIKTANPYHHINDEGLKKKAKKMFGTAKTTVLAFHNQWLFAGTALLAALNVLEYNDGIGGNYYNPFCVVGARNLAGHRDLDYYNKIVESIMNLIREDNPFRGKTWLGSWMLNEHEPKMRHDFTLGDNNDGITIIDAIENKYCFMNISDYKYDEKAFNSSDLPYLKPVDGKAYLEAYCPSTVKSNKGNYYAEQAREEGGEEGFKKYVKEARDVNRPLINRIKKFEVLTEDELKEIFPKVYAD